MEKIYLVSNGDSRLSANRQCWETQLKMETLLSETLSNLKVKVVRAHSFDKDKQHGFIDSQKYGIEVFQNIPNNAPVIIAESVWQYSQFVIPGLYDHKGPILTIANWEGKYPGLVGVLNLNASLLKAGISYSTLWSYDFKDVFFIDKLKEWLKTGKISHDDSHVSPIEKFELTDEYSDSLKNFLDDFHSNKKIMGVFDEGCMGMFNAIVPDQLLNELGIFKERFSQSELYYQMSQISDQEANEVLQWLIDQGLSFEWGEDPKFELTESQSLEQCKMYIAAVRMAHEHGCDTIGIQYQQGLKNLTAASDLVEGLLNNQSRPPVFDVNGEELYANEAIPHFNEVDECAGIDGLLTYRLWKHLNLPPENTLHDLRYGEELMHQGRREFVWLLMISGAVPAAHLENGYKSATSVRQPAMFFANGGGTLKGVSKPGYVVWSRIYLKDNMLFCDVGTGESVRLDNAENERRWKETNPEWPMMNIVFHGVTKNQMMARHKSNHIQVAYVNHREELKTVALMKAKLYDRLGIKVNICNSNF